MNPMNQMLIVEVMEPCNEKDVIVLDELVLIGDRVYMDEVLQIRRGKNVMRHNMIKKIFLETFYLVS